MSERAFVLGLDGIPWNLIEKWTDAGELPNFERVRSEGAGGPFESTTPATTPVAWPSIATGVRADKHGVYGFQELTEEYSHQMNTSADVDHSAIWDILSPAVVGNVPMTYPASDIDGTMVAGMMAPEITEQFTHPPEFASELQAEIEDYRISLPWREFTDEDEALLPEFEGLVSARRDLMQLLMDRHDDWRLFFFVYTAPDRLQHLFWDEDVLLDHYKELDDMLGEVMEYVDEEDANLFIVSDHGFGPTEKAVNVNRLLEREGYLAENENTGIRSALDSVGVNRSAMTETLAKVGLDEDTIVSMLPRSVVDSVAEKVPGEHALYDVDFDRTTAFLHFHGAVYVNDTERFADGIVDPGERSQIASELRDLFENLTDPETGDRMLRVHDGADLFPTDERAPDLIVKGAEGYLVENSLSDSIVAPAGMAAGHEPEGIFLAWGPSIEAGSEPADADVYDFLPTVLQSVGEPVPATADGRVLTEVFDPDSAAATEGIEFADYGDGPGEEERVDDDFDDVEERLKGLGYMS